MTDDSTLSKEDWARTTLDKAVQDLSDLGVIPDAVPEARSMW